MVTNRTAMFTSRGDINDLRCEVQSQLRPRRALAEKGTHLWRKICRLIGFQSPFQTSFSYAGSREPICDMATRARKGRFRREARLANCGCPGVRLPGTPVPRFVSLRRNGHFQRKRPRGFVDNWDLCHGKAARLQWLAPLLDYHFGLKRQMTSREAMPGCCVAADRRRNSARRVRTRLLHPSVIRLLETRRPTKRGSARLLIQSNVRSAIEPPHRASGLAQTGCCQGLGKGRHNQVVVSSHYDN